MDRRDKYGIFAIAVLLLLMVVFSLSQVYFQDSTPEKPYVGSISVTYPQIVGKEVNISATVWHDKKSFDEYYVSLTINGDVIKSGTMTLSGEEYTGVFITEYIFSNEGEYLIEVNDYSRSVNVLGLINSYDLFQEYEMNEISADNKYKNKIIVVRGTIRSIGRDVLRNAYVKLEGEGELGIQSFFTKERESDLIDLVVGEEILIMGKCEGKGLGNIYLKESRIIE